MCKPASDIHFCTCTFLNKKPFPIVLGGEIAKDAYETTNFIWTLYNYLGKKDELMLGEIILPVESLGEEMTSENLLKQLNSRNCFDFNYSPIEGDNLEIRKAYIYKTTREKSRPDLYDYMSFIYRHGIWQEDYYDFFTDKTQQIKKGIIK